MVSSFSEERECIEGPLRDLADAVRREELTIEQATNEIKKYPLNSESILAAGATAGELTKSDISLARILALLAYEAGRAIGNEIVQATTALSLANVLNFAGMYSDALELLLRECLVVFQRTSEREFEAATLHCLGNVYENTGDYETAWGYFEQSLRLSKDLKLKRMEYFCLVGLGSICTRRSDFNRAKSHFEEALRLYNASGDKDDVNKGIILGNLGIALRHLSDYNSAIRCHEQALRIAQEKGDKYNEAIQLNDLGLVYEGLGEYGKAWEYFNQAVELSQLVEDKQNEASSLANLGQLASFVEEYDRAISVITRVLRHNQETRDRKAEGIQSGSLSSVYLEVNDHERAEYYANRALLIGKEIGDKHLEAISNALLGEVLEKVGNHKKARDYYLRSIDLHRELVDIDGELKMHAHLGKLYEHYFKDDTRAYDSFKSSIRLLDQIRTSLVREEHKIGFGGRGVDVYGEMISLCLRMYKDAEAFEYSERARSRAFLDQLSHGDILPPKNIAADLLVKERGLISLMRKTHIALRSAKTDEQRHIHSASITRAREDLVQVLGEMQRDAPEYVAMRRGSPVTLEEVKTYLTNRMVLAEYFTAKDKTLIFIVRTDLDKPEVEEVKVPVDELLNFVEMNFSLAEGGSQDIHLASEEWQDFCGRFVEPIMKYTDEGDILYLIPHGLLHYLPLHALKYEDKYLIERHPIVYSPSASVIKYCQNKRKGKRRTCLVLGDSLGTEGQPDLLYAREEAKIVAELFNAESYLHAKATKGIVQQIAKDKDVIHFACHGAFDPNQPMKAGIELADGRLTAEEIFNSELNADLVTLSACESGVNERKPGDELVGLTRALIYAGTPSVLVSLWTVDDYTTSFLMQRFYTYLASGEISTKVEALQKAQVDTMREIEEKDTRGWKPHYWAPFTLVGDWK
jgi:CHAT domain-containing protein/tetratricopeptide (TPR) repeat protein